MILILLVALLVFSERVLGDVYKDIGYVQHHSNVGNVGHVGHSGVEFGKYVGPQDYAAKDCKANQCQDYHNLVGLGREENENHLISPCALNDWQCIRKFFADNSNCKPAFGPVPDPLFSKRNTAYYAFANLTLVYNDLTTTGLRSIQVNDFYVNKETNNLVIAFAYQTINGASPRTYFRYHRNGKESIVLYDFVTYNMGSGILTVVIPGIPHLRLDLAEVSAYTNPPSFVVGPKAYASTDPDVISSYARLNSNAQLVAQEFFLFQSQLLAATYIQKNICDFGLELVSI